METNVHLLVLVFLLPQLLERSWIWNSLMLLYIFYQNHLFILFNRHSALDQFKEFWMVIVVWVKRILNNKLSSVNKGIAILFLFGSEQDNAFFKLCNFFCADIDHSGSGIFIRDFDFWYLSHKFFITKSADNSKFEHVDCKPGNINTVAAHERQFFFCFGIIPNV